MLAHGRRTWPMICVCTIDIQFVAQPSFVFHLVPFTMARFLWDYGLTCSEAVAKSSGTKRSNGNGK